MRQKTAGGQVFVTTYTYDALGNLTAMVYPTGHRVDYVPDPADPGQVAQVLLNTDTALATDLSYQPFGPLASMTLGNGLDVAWTRDTNYQLMTIRAGSVMDRAYTPDNAGNITHIDDLLDASRSQTFTYDPMTRLVRAQGIYGTINYTYDKVGNRKSRIRNDEADTYHYDPESNRLKTIVGTHAERIVYDEDGNPVQRILGAGHPGLTGTTSLDFTYNTQNLRTRTQGAAHTLFHYDQTGRLIAESAPDGTPIKAYIWLHNQPLALVTQSGAIHYYHNDHLGTPQRLTDHTATLSWSADYLPFGKADVTLQTIENNLRFPGQYYDSETGLHYNWNRYYDPGTGKYLTADPIGLVGGINLYAYVLNDPINDIDPMGLMGSQAAWVEAQVLYYQYGAVVIDRVGNTLLGDGSPTPEKVIWDALMNGKDYILGYPYLDQEFIDALEQEHKKEMDKFERQLQQSTEQLEWLKNYNKWKQKEWERQNNPCP